MLTSYAIRALSAALTLIYTMAVFATCSVPLDSQAPAAAPQQQVPLGYSDAPVVLSILHAQGSTLPLQEAAELFVASHPGTQIRIHTVDGQTEYQTALRARLLTGEKIDLFHLFGYQDLLSLQEYTDDLSDLDWAKNAVDGLLEPVILDGKLYGIPYSVEGVGLIANRQIFEAAGISLQSIVTFEDLSEAFQALQEKIDSGELNEDFPQLQYVTEFPALDKGFISRQLADLLLTDAFSTPRKAAESGSVNLHYGEAVEEYLRLMARHSSSRRGWRALNDVSQSLQVEGGLATGRVAIIQQSTEIYTNISKLNPQIADRLTLLPIPLEELETSSVYLGAPSYWAVNANSSDQSAALAREFLTWLYQSEAGAALLADRFAVLSPYQDTARDTGNPLHNRLLSLASNGRSRPWLHQEYPPGWGDFLVQSVRDYLNDELEWDDLLENSTLLWVKSR